MNVKWEELGNTCSQPGTHEYELKPQSLTTARIHFDYTGVREDLGHFVQELHKYLKTYQVSLEIRAIHRPVNGSWDLMIFFFF